MQASQELTKGLKAPVVVELNQGRYRDDKFYLNHLPSDHLTEASLQVHGDSKSRLASAVMDLMGEDQSTFMKSQRRFHWVSLSNITSDPFHLLLPTFIEASVVTH